MGLFDKLFGSYSEKEIKKITPLVDKVEALEEEYKALSDEALKAKTAEFKERYKNGETLDDLLPEAFAAVREAADRVTGMRPFRVQILGGIILHQGRIAEMKTGEGKTLVATMPVYLNALAGEGVHVVTVNEYLAKRDSEEMGRIYKFLGMKVGLSVREMSKEEKQAAYNADITYGTNNEFGFDYLRDNMVIRKEHMVQRGHFFAVVDEVDSILIDEARTPLIISGEGQEATDLYERTNILVRGMTPKVVTEQDTKLPIEEYTDCDYVVDEKAKSVVLTPRGIAKAEKYFNTSNIASPENSEIYHHINQAMKAYGTMKRDVDYVVRPDGVIIVDEFTGRLMFGRRYSNGLHQAIEAKEGVKVEKENRTLATITFQNYFRLYKKLSGMTGTAITEEDEFVQIYKTDVLEVPTNRPMIREDHPDMVYKTEAAKYRAIIEQIKECYAKKQPVLVGTISIEKSEYLGKLLKKERIPHNILNAKYHEKEAEIIAQAGRSGAVTIATNMAGRGTDIRLGGNPEFMAKEQMRAMGINDELILESSSVSETDNEEILNARNLFKKLYNEAKEQTTKEAEEVKAAGGLFIVGTERHESRRIDNQLRGRSGRQGDIGHSRFYLSLEDDLMRLFGGDRVNAVFNTLKVDENMPIESGMVSGIIESSQKRVENAHFERRKRVLEYDDVINTQRNMIYTQRKEVLDGADVKESIQKMIPAAIAQSVGMYANSSNPKDWNMEGIKQDYLNIFMSAADFEQLEKEITSFNSKKLENYLLEKANEAYAAKEKKFGPEIMRELERVVLLKTVDKNWMDQIDAMDDLKQGIGLRSYGQVDPVVAYRNEGTDMYEQMIENIRMETVRNVIRPMAIVENRSEAYKITGTSHGGEAPKKTTVIKKQKVGRNDPCPCGSGKKYKKCCGANE